jgi:hypothetical protein
MTSCNCGPNQACSECPKSITQADGSCSEWRTPDPIIERQRGVIAALQRRVLRDADGRPSGDVKDTAIALGVALDKLELLTRNH